MADKVRKDQFLWRDQENMAKILSSILTFGCFAFPVRMSVETIPYSFYIVDIACFYFIFFLTNLKINPEH